MDRQGGIVDQLVQHYGLDRDASVKKFLEDRQMPMGIGNPEDVAHAVVFLASPLARFITGAGLDIGGTIRGLVLAIFHNASTRRCENAHGFHVPCSMFPVRGGAPIGMRVMF